MNDESTTQAADPMAEMQASLVRGTTASSLPLATSTMGACSASSATVTVSVRQKLRHLPVETSWSRGSW